VRAIAATQQLVSFCDAIKTWSLDQAKTDKASGFLCDFAALVGKANARAADLAFAVADFELLQRSR
jgi:hypothetical protein